MPARATHNVKPHEVGGFHTNERQRFVHLVAAGPAVVTLCGKPVDTLIPLDGFNRLRWDTVCPTCLDGAPGFLEYWRENHQPIPF